MSWSSLPDTVVEYLVGQILHCAYLPWIALVERRCSSTSARRLAVMRQLTCQPFSLHWFDITESRQVFLAVRNLNSNVMRTFAQTLANGALLSVEHLYLNASQISDVGLTALAHAIKPASMGGSGALARCSFLSLANNRFGDGGLHSLVDAFCKGALAQCISVDLRHNHFGHDAMHSLADALSKGCLPVLKHLVVLKDASVLKAICEGRKIAYY